MDKDEAVRRILEALPVHADLAADHQVEELMAALMVTFPEGSAMYGILRTYLGIMVGLEDPTVPGQDVDQQVALFDTFLLEALQIRRKIVAMPGTLTDIEVSATVAGMPPLGSTSSLN